MNSLANHTSKEYRSASYGQRWKVSQKHPSPLLYLIATYSCPTYLPSQLLIPRHPFLVTHSSQLQCSISVHGGAQCMRALAEDEPPVCLPHLLLAIFGYRAYPFVTGTCSSIHNRAVCSSIVANKQCEACTPANVKANTKAKINRLKHQQRSVTPWQAIITMRDTSHFCSNQALRHRIQLTRRILRRYRQQVHFIHHIRRIHHRHMGQDILFILTMPARWRRQPMDSPLPA